MREFLRGRVGQSLKRLRGRQHPFLSKKLSLRAHMLTAVPLYANIPITSVKGLTMGTSSDNKNLPVCKKTIGELSKDAKTFFIPSYQRGYRWGENEVKQLFDDLWGAMKANKEYCLQPLVVMKKGNQWCVIDGQQRLTTLYILLKVLGQEPGFSLEYETRPKSEEFLANIVKKNEENATNPDYWYMWKAKEKLEEKKKKTDEKPDAVNQEDFASWIKAKTFFLWYEPEGDEHEIFARLNSGKIPLSNAELIKAELLSKKKGNEQALAADDWDRIEHRLQDDDFWCFVNPAPAAFRFQAAHIDFLFELWDRQGGDNGKVEDAWEYVKKIFSKMEEWYDNLRLYHLIGFLMVNRATNEKARFETLLELLALATNEKTAIRRSEFAAKVGSLCREALFGDALVSDCLKQWEYDSNNYEIQSALLLFNLALTDHKGLERTRFPFGVFKKTTWSIEHIHPQDAGGVNDFGNLALLPTEINSEFREGDFHKKRGWIRTWLGAPDDEGKYRVARVKGFIPLGTRLAFARFLGREQGEEWNESMDGKLYLDFVARTIENYLKNNK